MSDSKNKFSMMWIVAGVLVLIALVAAFAPGLLSWLLPVMGCGSLAGAVAANKTKRKEEKAAAALDREEIAETQVKIDAKKEELADATKQQQKLFITHGEEKAKLEEEYKQVMAAAVDEAAGMTPAEKLAYLKSKKPTPPTGK